jgi:two-component system, LuxR family, sensor kinase FixL
MRLNAIIATATDGIISIGEDGIIELANPAAARLFGYTNEELLGQNISMLMPSPHDKKHDGYILRYLQTGEAKIIGIGREVMGRKSDGTLFPIRLSISEVALQDRRVFTGIIHDLSEQKMAEEAQRQAEQRITKLNAELEKRVETRTEELAQAVNQLLATNQKLEHEIKERRAAERAMRANEYQLKLALEKEKELSELKSRFVSMASHEFRTPLSTILSSADLIEAYAAGDQQERRLRHTARIKTAVANLTSILNDFLSLSRLEEGKVEPQPVEFNLASFCHELAEELGSLLQKGQQLHFAEVDAKLNVFLDQKMLKNIFLNLLSNSIKYSGPGQPIECRVSVEGDCLHAAFIDHGIGIPEGEQRHIFTRFFRAHNAENIQGTGLGLNIVQQYVELLQGKITFESQQGKGTTFYLRLPLAQKNAPAIY